LSRPPIRLLDPDTAARIAAGEVIERPVSALKEILENSLDAGAHRIEIAVRGSLAREFEVSDDGVGIARAELPLALEAHATSKIHDIDDLARLETLGFRGEALPAIARASRLSIETRTGDEDEGSRIEVDGGEHGPAQPVGRARGTTVVVRDLFYNLPARRKFLRTDRGELRAATRLVTAYALAFPEVAFRFVVDSRERLQAPAAQDLSERVATVFGRRFLDQCLEAREERPGVFLTAFLAVPELARLTREAQVFLLNRRWVQSPLLSQAVRHAYGNLIPPARHPACVVDLRVDPATIDVNVHPTKREIRFAHEDLVFSFLSKSAAKPLSRLTPRYQPEGRPATDPVAPSLGELVRDHDSQMPLWGKGKTRQGSDHPSLSLVPQGSRTLGPAEVRDGEGGMESGSPVGAEGGIEPGLTSRETGRPRLANLWQLHDTYLLAPVSGGLVIIDQHAAHERILYEEAVERMGTSSGASQQLLFPLVIDITRSEFDLVIEVLDPLTRLGFDLAPISAPTVLIRGVPPGVGDRNPGELLKDILDGLGETGGRQIAEDEMGDRLAKSYACHAAVRAGQPLSLEEMNHLVDRLFATTLPHGDPHGRPTFVRVDINELHSRFGRSGPRS
jgi:DNA mismatch repair protein MutL